MVSASKILTVSYGTFSCTLEGFDDPFSAMKDIAEYFRDLAADDRYFGAEPPTPDTEMLHRIAERSSQSTVSAELGENSLTLRPTEQVIQQDAPAQADPTPAPAPAVETTVEDAQPTPAKADESPREDAALGDDAILAAIADTVQAVPVEEPVKEPAQAPEAEVETAQDPEVPASDDASEEADGLDPDTVAARLARIQEAAASAVEDADEHEDEHADGMSNADALEALEDNLVEEVTETPAEAVEVADQDSDEYTEDLDEDDAFEAALAEELAADTAPQTPAEPTAQEAPAAPAVVVRKVAKADRAAEVSEDVTAAGASDLDPDAEADLMAELAEIERENAARRAESLPPVADQDEAALERLFDATEGKMSDADASQRRAHISHIKAAVAARKADSAAGEGPEHTDDTEAYREDLAEVVKPRRPKAAPARTERPKAAPLVLVSEQRVDEAAPAEEKPKGPISPRRPRREAARAIAEQAPASQASDFEDFAQEMGAVELADILEAAAAYTVQVEGSETFSRPQLLRMAAAASTGMTREDGLRGFGQLLREGTIKKIKRGAFELTDGSRYAKPAAQRAAG